MKHYKYDLDNKVTVEAFREKIDQNIKEANKNSTKRKMVMRLCFAAFFAVTALVAYFAYTMNQYVKNEIAAMVIGTIIIVVYSLIVVFLLKRFKYDFIMMFHKKQPYEINEETLLIITAPYKEYYHVCENSIVTKCYNSTNKYMINKDVLIFIYDNKIRITNDFYNSYKDFGCYEFGFDEIKIHNEKVDNKTVTFIECEDFRCELGCRAKAFISKQFGKDKS